MQHRACRSPGHLLALVATTFLLATAAAAAELARPAGEVILTVTGRIARTNADGRAEFDRAMLEHLGLDKLRTWTPWTESEPEFTGIPAKALMDHLGAEGVSVRARALNDYEITIPLSDFEDYRVLLALGMNGEPLRTRDKGPLWLIYPWSDHPELDDRVTRQRSIWQLRSLDVK